MGADPQLMEFFRHLPDYLGWAVASLTALVALVLMARKASAKAKVLADRASAVGDVLLGRPAIVHPETGEILLPEAPGIGTRMASIEGWQSEVGPILASLARTQTEMNNAGRRIDRLDEIMTMHIGNHHNQPGRPGERGETGRPGAVGETGKTGEAGETGKTGEAGEAGTPGLNGQNGQNG